MQVNVQQLSPVLVEFQVEDFELKILVTAFRFGQTNDGVHQFRCIENDRSGFGTITDELVDLDFTFNHDGLMGTGWYRQAFTEDDLLAVLAALDALPEPITIEANLLRIHLAQNPGRQPRTS